MKAYVSASIAAISLGRLIASHSTLSSLILGIIIGVTLSKKVNQLNLIYGLALTLSVSFLWGFKVPDLWLLIVIALVSFVDEMGHDKFASTEGFVAKFFRYRLSLKLIVLILTTLSVLQTIFAISFLCFDITYDLTGMLINQYSRNKEAFHNSQINQII